MSNTTRRDFLRTVASGAALAVASPALALARDEPKMTAAVNVTRLHLKPVEQNLAADEHTHHLISAIIKEFAERHFGESEMLRLVGEHATVMQDRDMNRICFAATCGVPLFLYKCTLTDSSFLHTHGLHFVDCKLIATPEGPRVSRDDFIKLKAEMVSESSSAFIRDMEYFSYNEWVGAQRFSPARRLGQRCVSGRMWVGYVRVIRPASQITCSDYLQSIGYPLGFKKDGGQITPTTL